MHYPWRLTAALAVSFGVIGAASAATTAAPPAAAASTKPPAAAKPAGPSDRAQIEALEKGLNAGFNAKNVDKIMSYYAREGLFVFDVTPPRQHVGWADYKKDWEDLLAAFPGPVTNQISEQSITVVGSVAYGHNIQDGHFTAKDGSALELVVRVTDVYRKAGGKWKIVQEHVSVPVDLATLKPDLLSKP
ncbi:MAG: YybH family protein [Caulobacterales bacterium]